MLVLLDTNAFHGDVYAAGGGLSTLFTFAANRDDVEVAVPAGVVEELVRQFGERLPALQRNVKTLSYELRSLGFPVPAFPEDLEKASADYRETLMARLTGPHRTVAAHPASSGLIIDWVAQRRHPIKPRASDVAIGQNDPTTSEQTEKRRRKSVPVDGVVDAGIWLTLIELAQQQRGEIVLVSRNTSDFADPADKTRLHPFLIADLQDAQVNPSRIQLQPTVAAFNEKHVAPSAEAEAAAQTLLADAGSHASLVSEIEDAVEWFPTSLDSSWSLDVEVDESAMTEFAVSDLDLIRADPAPRGFFMQMLARGSARFDLGIRKSDAYGIQEDSPIHVYDWDWNESMVAAEVELPTELSLDVLVEGDAPNYNLGVSIEGIEPPSEHMSGDA